MAISSKSRLISIASTGVALWLACLTLPLPAQQPGAVSPTLALQTLDLDVDPARQSEPFVQQFEIKINDDVANQFGPNNPLQWSPNLVQQSLNPTPEFEKSHGKVSLGFSAESDITIRFDRKPLLLKGAEQEPRTLTLTINKPGTLKPGVYEGKVDTELHSLKTGDKRPFAWPLRLRVRGISVTSIKFVAVDESVTPAALRVGMPASVRVHVRTIECEPTGGQFELTWKREQNSPDAPASIVRLPLAAMQTWIDPKVSLPPGAHCDAKWLGDPLLVRLVGSAPSNSQGVNLHEFEISLPQVFDVGQWTSKVSWPKFAGQTMASETVHSLVAHSGVRVQPALPAVDEDVEFIANLDAEAEGPIHLRITHPDQTVETIVVKKEGTYYKPESSWRAPATGRYAVEIVGKNQASGSTVFDVPLEIQEDLQERDLYAFVGAAYFPFDWLYGAKWGGGWEALRQDAYRLQTNPANLVELRASLTGIVAVKGEGGSQDQLLTESVHWAREPEFSFPGHPSGKGKLAVYNKEPTKPTSGVPLLEWTADPANHAISFDLNASVRDPENPKDSPRQITGPREFEMRLLVTGTSEGQPVARIVTVPFGVSIYKESQYYIPALLYSLGGLAVVVVAAAGVRWMTPKVVRSTSSATTSSSSEHVFEPSEDYTPQIVHPTTAAPVAASGAVMASPDQSEPDWTRGVRESQPSPTMGSAGGFGVSSGFGPEE